MKTASETSNLSAGRWRIARSRGAVTGVLLMLCGIWGALVPFIGPYFHFAFSPDVTWHWTTARFWLEVLPGIVAFVGGFLVLMSGNRATAVLGAELAMGAGAWFIVGPTLSMLWHHSAGYAGAPVGGNSRQSFEQIAFFYGIGAVTLLLGSISFGRLSVHSVRDVRAAERREARAAEAAAATTVAAPAPVTTTAQQERVTTPATSPAAPVTDRPGMHERTDGRSDDTAVYPHEPAHEHAMDHPMTEESARSSREESELR